MNATMTWLPKGIARIEPRAMIELKRRQLRVKKSSKELCILRSLLFGLPPVAGHPTLDQKTCVVFFKMHFPWTTRLGK